MDVDGVPPAVAAAAAASLPQPPPPPAGPLTRRQRRRLAVARGADGSSVRPGARQAAKPAGPPNVCGWVVPRLVIFHCANFSRRAGLPASREFCALLMRVAGLIAVPWVELTCTRKAHSHSLPCTLTPQTC
jgi:hypothetical protein